MRYEEDTSSGEERFFQDVHSRKVLLILCLVIGVFGGLLAVAGIGRLLKTPGPDDLFLLVMGLGIVFFGRRLWKFTTGPRMIFSVREVVLVKFFRSQRWQIGDISSIASFPTIIYPRAPNGKASPMNAHFLGIKARSGKVSKFVLPAFVGNEQLLTSLAAKTKLTIEDIEDDAGFEAWRNSSFKITSS